MFVIIIKYSSTPYRLNFKDSNKKEGENTSRLYSS